MLKNTQDEDRRLQSRCLLLTLFPFSGYNAVMRSVREKLALTIF